MLRPMRVGCLVLVLLPAVGLAQPYDGWDIERYQAPVPANLSPDFLDPAGRTRFHVTTRATWSNPDEVFGSTSRFSLEAQGALRITPGLAFTFGLPFGVVAPDPGNNAAFFGNFRIGLHGGGYIRLAKSKEFKDQVAPRLGIGLAVDFYVPTGPNDPLVRCLLGSGCAPPALVRDIRSLEAEYYLPDAISFRNRLHVDFQHPYFGVEGELGLSPSWTLASNADFSLLLSWGLRLVARPIYELEPFVELGSVLVASGEKDDAQGFDIATPVRLNLGARFHVAELDPAIFVAIDFVDGGLLFGLDLAGAVREVTRREQREYLEGFEIGADQ